MAPAAARDIQLKLLISAEEKAMLNALAEADDVTPTAYVRAFIQRTYARRFSKLATPTKPTMRGVITDMTGPAHYTAGNIAVRTGLALDKVLASLTMLEKLRIVERVSATGFSSTWGSLFGDTKATCARAEKAGLDLDEEL